MKYCVLIIATVKSVPYFHRNRTINVQRKKPQTCFCFTPHNSQGSTQEYMKADFNRTSKAGKVNTVSVNQGTLLMALSRPKSRAKLQLCNVDCDPIKVNITALHEIKRLKEHVFFPWQYHIAEDSGNKWFY